MIADLSMYDWPVIRPATDRFWREVAARLRAVGIDAPEALTRGRDHATSWTDPSLLIGQTCGMPYVSGLCGDAVIIAKPDYGLPGAADGFYRSVIVARTDHAGMPLLSRLGCRVAVNEWRSYSGHIALRAHLAKTRGRAAGPFFATAVLSGSHRASARLVAEGEADIAALDGVVWALLGAEEPETASRLAVIAETDPAPALPFITAASNAGLSDQLAEALAGAAAALEFVPGLPRRVMPASAADYEPTRAAARRAAGVAFATGAPSVPEV
jgi:ABC-type phosphate/phosphonate transport system substrate-binding protein